MDQLCLDLTLRARATAEGAGTQPGPEASIFKLYGTELNKRRRELMIAIGGAAGPRLGGRRLRRGRARADARLAALARQHDRGRHVGDPAQHHRQARARPPRLSGRMALVLDRRAGGPRADRARVRARSARRSRIRELRDATTPTASRATLWREMAELGWLGIVDAGGVRRRRARLHRAQMVVLEEMGRGLMPRARALDGAARRRRAPARRQRRRSSRSTCRRSPPASGCSRSRTRRPAAATTPAQVATRARARAATAGGSTARRSRCSTATSPTALIVVGAHVRRAAATPTASRSSWCRATRPASRSSGSRASTAATSPGAARRRDGRRRRRARRGGPGRRAPRAACSIAPPSRSRAEMLGGLDEAFEMTLEYLKTRKQFGVPIGSFQALKHRAASMYIELELARSVVLRGAARARRGRDDERRRGSPASPRRAARTPAC